MQFSCFVPFKGKKYSFNRNPLIYASFVLYREWAKHLNKK